MWRSVHLPAQGKDVQLNVSSTFMYGGTSIDLVWVSNALDGACTMVVHNGIHCKQNGCKNNWCCEVARSDHFLCEVVVSRNAMPSRDALTSTSRPCMPEGFRDAQVWKVVLVPLLGLVGVLGELLQPSSED